MQIGAHVLVAAAGRRMLAGACFLPTVNKHRDRYGGAAMYVYIRGQQPVKCVRVVWDRFPPETGTDC